MNRISKRVLLAVLVLAGLLAGAEALAQAPAQTPVRIGVYDSRYVALAYYRSEPWKKHMSSLMADLEKAKAAKDTARVRELEAKGPALQNLMHQQVFGSLSIPNVLETVKDRIPAIAAEAKVALLVSKWDILHPTDACELVDLTPKLIELFPIDDATRKMIQEGMKEGVKPVPVDQLLNPYE